jgi:hypothetical protein
MVSVKTVLILSMFQREERVKKKEGRGKNFCPTVFMPRVIPVGLFFWTGISSPG